MPQKDEKFQKVAEIEPKKTGPGGTESTKDKSAGTDSTSTSAETRDTRSQNANATAGSGLGEIRVAAEEVEGQEVPVTADGAIDPRPRDGVRKEQEQVLVIPDDPDLYPVIRTVNDPADHQSQQDAEAQRIMEVRRQGGFQGERDTPVTERELRRRMNEQPS